MKKTRIIIIGDNCILVQGLSSLISSQTDLKVVSVFGDVEKSETHIRESKPDVILIDFHLQSKNSLHTVKAINKNFHDIKLLLINYIPAQEDLLKFMQAGISGFILKNAAVKEILTAIRLVAKGDVVLPTNLTGSLFSQIKKYTNNNHERSRNIETLIITKRERQIIKLIAEGMSNKEIEEKLNLSLNTVKSHIHNILGKLELQTRSQIVKYFFTKDEYVHISDTISLLEE